MTETEPRTWPAAFTSPVRAIIRARDTPPGWDAPRCVVCGLPVNGRVEYHHILPRGMGGKGGGDGRPSNGLCAHPACHAAVEKHRQDARDEGLLRSRHAPRPAVYAQPVRCAWRGPIVLTDQPGPDGRYWRPEPGPWPGPAEIPEWRGVGA